MFGYGSLLWRPGFQYHECMTARICGWERRFWQGSPDHRGTPRRPGRVVTLVQAGDAGCTGKLYAVNEDHVEQVIRYLDHRESGGYQRLWVTAHDNCGRRFRALTYVALPGNPHYLGPAATVEMKAQIRASKGPSGTNVDYCRMLHSAMSALEVPDAEWHTLPLDGLLG
ncbi:MAG: gamma-glutamylcyclotransferase [Gammaproteobacteria bacterium]|nr:gamma-glutamylcyclotransferase [Gammaproteobacteria bacterium]